MPLIYKPYQATLANKEGQKLYYPRLVQILENGQYAENGRIGCRKASLTAGDVLT